MSEDISAFLEQSRRCDPLSKPEEKRLIALAQENPPDQEAWDKLIRHNIRLVINIAKGYLNQGLSFEDLIQEGLYGLVISIRKFDLSRGALSTYATHWIRQAITRAIDNQGRTIRIPIHRLNEYRLIRRLYREYIEEHGQPPNAEDLSEMVRIAALKDAKGKIREMSAEEIELLGRMFHPMVRLDDPNSEDENLTMMDYLGNPEAEQPENLAERVVNSTQLKQLLRYLSDEDRLFIMKQFGLLDGKEADRKALAAFRRMSEDEVESKTEQILKQLREYANRDSVNL